MSSEIIDVVIEVLEQRKIEVLDLTGGAPELNPHFRRLVEAARSLGVEVIDRCNLTVLFEEGQADLATFLARKGVTITASLPCYEEENVSAQRGKGTYEKSIDALQLLNQLGYGKDADKQLNLVYNPVGPNLPPAQDQLEADYKKNLGDAHGVVFNQLFTITNMPISRFGAVLLAQGDYDNYMDLLKSSFSPSNLETVMCKDLVSIDWQGYLYDCDFNQMLELPIGSCPESSAEVLASTRPHVRSLLSSNMAGNEIMIGEHCFGCTAGQGSSCGGALAE